MKMTKLTFNKTDRIIAAVTALVLIISAFLWLAPTEAHAQTQDIGGVTVNGFAARGTGSPITDGMLTGGSIGVYVTSSSSDGRFSGSNLKFIYNNDVWEPAPDQYTALFENNGDRQRIAAYYPYIPDVSLDVIAVTLPEAYDADYGQYDYLWGEYAPFTSNSATLELNHLMSKVTVTVSGGGTEASEMNVASVALIGVPRTADWRVPGDILYNFGESESIGLYCENGSYVGYALPNQAEALTLCVTLDSGSIFTATVSLDDTATPNKTECLEGGVHYRLAVNIGDGGGE